MVDVPYIFLCPGLWPELDPPVLNCDVAVACCCCCSLLVDGRLPPPAPPTPEIREKKDEDGVVDGRWTEIGEGSVLTWSCLNWPVDGPGAVLSNADCPPPPNKLVVTVLNGPNVVVPPRPPSGAEEMLVVDPRFKLVDDPVNCSMVNIPVGFKFSPNADSGILDAVDGVPPPPPRPSVAGLPMLP